MLLCFPGAIKLLNVLIFTCMSKLNSAIDG